MQGNFDPFAPMGLRSRVAPKDNTLVQMGFPSNRYYTKAETNAAIQTAINTIPTPNYPVTSVFGRTGAITTSGGDYNASQISVTTSGSQTQTDVQKAINFLNLKSSRFNYFVFDPNGAQTYPFGNRFNTFSDMHAHFPDLEGEKTALFERDFTIPSGSYNFDYVTPKGNGLEYNAGGYTLTFGDNTTITSWLKCNFDSIRLLSTSATGNICTFSAASLIGNNSVSNVHSTNYPFFKFTGSGQMIVSLNNSARWRKLAGGVENLDVTSSAFAAQLIVARGKGSTIENDTLKSTNAVIFIDVLQDGAQDPTTFTLTNTNLSVGFLVSVNAVYSTNQNHIPVTKSADFTFTRAAEVYAINASGGAITASLPPATGSGVSYTGVKSDSSINAVTIDADGSDVINSITAWGAANYSLPLQGNAATFIDHATGYWLVTGAL